MQSWIRPNSNPNLINTEQEHNHFIKIIKSISDWYYIKYFLYLSSSALKFSILLVVKWSPIAFFTWHGLQHLITDLLSHLKNWIPWKNHIISYRYFLITIFHVHVTTSYGLFYGICGCGSPAQNVLPLIKSTAALAWDILHVMTMFTIPILYMNIVCIYFERNLTEITDNVKKIYNTYEEHFHRTDEGKRTR